MQEKIKPETMLKFIDENIRSNSRFNLLRNITKINHLMKVINYYDKSDRTEIYDLLQNIIRYDYPDRHQVYDLLRRIIYNKKLEPVFELTGSQCLVMKILGD